MNRLQPQFYISFQVKQADYKMLLIDLSLYSNLKRNAQFIKFLSAKKNENCLAVSTEELILMKKEFLKKEKKSRNPKIESLDSLHLNVVKDDRIFEQFPMKKEQNIYLMTERFFWPCPTANLGSARHALLLNMQIKGIGRTPLAIRHDHSHTWGGQYIWQAVKSYVVGKIIEGASPLGILKTPYVAIKDEKRETPQVNSHEIGLSIREANALRVTQVIADFEPGYKLTKDIVMTELLNNLSTSSLKNHLKNITFHYASLFLLGIRHMAITRENVTLEGKLIDYEDIKIESDPEYFNIFVETKSCIGKKKLKRYEGDVLYTSTLHLMLNAIIFTHIGFSKLDRNYKININQIKNDFQEMITKLSVEVFDIDKNLLSFIDLLLKTDPDYQSGQLSLLVPSMTFNSGAKKIIKRIEDLEFTITNKEITFSETATHYNVKFPRVRFKNKFIESFNINAICQVEKVVEKSFLMLQLESFAGDMNFESMIDYSSICNEFISKHSLSYPYALVDKKVVLKTESAKNLWRRYKTKFKDELGANLVSFEQVRDPNSKQSIIRGAKIELSTGKSHFIAIPPTLVSDSTL